MTHEIRFEKAAVLVYFSLGLGIPNIILAEKYNPAATGGATEIIFAFIIMALIAGLAYQIGKQRQWAVWTYTVTCLLGLLAIGNVATAFEQNFLYGLISASQFGLQFSALYVMHADALKHTLGFNEANQTNANRIQTGNVIPFKSPIADLPPKKHESISNLGDLEKLHELFKSGALTQDEFDSEKKKILKRAA